jgi:hypothetical protein
MKTEELPSLAKLFPDCQFHACPTCHKLEAWEEGGLCRECESNTPEAIAEREAAEAAHLSRCRDVADHELARQVSPEIRGTTIDHPEFNRGAWDRINGAWSPDSPDWLWLHSKASGRCKSRIAYLLLREQYINAIIPYVSSYGTFKGLPSMLWVDGDLLTDAFRVRHQYSIGERAMKEAHELVEAARTVRLLVIDDLSKRKLTGEAASDGLWEVIKHRHEWKLRTIITDNYTPEALEDVLHEKHAPYIIRRLAERCIQVDFDATPSESERFGQSRESQSGEY